METQRPLAQAENKPDWRNIPHAGGGVDGQCPPANDGPRYIDVIDCPVDGIRTRPHPANQQSRSAAIIQCAAAWREQQSRAIDAGDAETAILCEKCAQRFEAHLTKAQLRSGRMNAGISKALDATLRCPAGVPKTSGASESNTWLQ